MNLNLKSCRNKNKNKLMKDNLVRKSLFTQIIEALDNNELELASELLKHPRFHFS